MATHSNILAWEIPWTEDPARLYSPWGHKRVRHGLATKQQQYSSGPYCQYTKLICAGPGVLYSKVRLSPTSTSPPPKHKEPLPVRCQSYTSMI